MTIKVYSVAEMVAAERAADAAGHGYGTMMELAGRRVAEAIHQRYELADSQVLVLVGPGNNGGDGLVAGRYLAEAGANVTFYLLKPRDETDDNLARVQALGLEVLLSTDDHRFRGLYHRLRSCQILIDALLGTGAARPITGQLASIMEQVRAGIDERTNFQNNSPTLVSIASLTGAGTSEATADNRPAIIAVDCPSGMNCETGELDPLAIPAELTVSFAGPKRGHFLFPGAAACGELVVADIGIDARLPEVAQVPVELATLAEMRRLLPKRPADGHKGTFGTTLIAAGSIRYWGAPALAARGAFRAGTGLVTLAVPQRLRPALAGQFPEATYPPVTDTDLLGVSTANLLLSSLKAYRSILVGPGLGEAGSFIHALLDGLREPLEGSAAPPLVVDADGLNLLAETADWPSRLPAQSILTPHPAEMARLIGRSRSPVQPAERIDLAREKAAEWGQVVVLKGAYTIIAAPDGHSTILPFANPVLAVAGSGDVLAGVIAGLLAQGLAPYTAAVLGGYLHGAAGQIAADYWGDGGLLAGELADWLPHVRRALIGQES
jgi:ADP-dependent NAD(P)H-hydrate dehydratase / NAD(P)H-hydrate epimerase